MDNSLNGSASRSGVTVITDATDPHQGWIEMAFTLDELRIQPGIEPEQPTIVSAYFDVKSGSVCELLHIITYAHDKLAELVEAKH